MYYFVLDEYKGVSRGEISGVSNKTVAFPLRVFGTSGFTMPLDHPETDFVLEANARVKVYEDREDGTYLRHHGRLTTAEESAGEDGDGSITVTSADPLWMQFRRLIGKTKDGYKKGTVLAQVDRGAIITDMVNTTNAEDPSGLRMGVVQASSNAYVKDWYYKQIGAGISELCGTIDGPDVRVRPIEYDAGYYGELDVFGALGTQRDDAAWEYGEGKRNVKSYRRPVTIEGSLNRGFHLPQGFPDNAAGQVKSYEDATSIAARGLFEDVISAATDLTVDDLRQKLLEHHIRIRNGARQTVTFDPVRAVDPDQVPIFPDEYDVGDVVPFRAWHMRDGEPQLRIDVLLRIYQVILSIDAAGYATPALTLAPS